MLAVRGAGAALRRAWLRGAGPRRGSTTNGGTGAGGDAWPARGGAALGCVQAAGGRLGVAAGLSTAWVGCAGPSQSRRCPQYVVDLRSDTVTQPSEAMRRAMAQAAVGDDDYGEDPTVNELQHLAARFLGMEEALFVPTATMANLIAGGRGALPGAAGPARRHLRPGAAGAGRPRGPRQPVPSPPRAHLPGEHAQLGGGPGAAPRLPPAGSPARGALRAAGAHGRGAADERGSGPGRGAGADHPALRLGVPVLLQGPGRPGWGRARRPPGVCGGGLARAEAAGRRDAAGRRAGSRCPRRAGAGRGNAAQRPQQRPALRSRHPGAEVTSVLRQPPGRGDEHGDGGGDGGLAVSSRALHVHAGSERGGAG